MIKGDGLISEITQTQVTLSYRYARFYSNLLYNIVKK